MTAIVRDVKFALRMFAKLPTFTATAVLTLTLGVGGVTAIFSVVNAVLLRPLPYAEPDRVVQIWENSVRNGRVIPRFALSAAEFIALSRRNTVMEDMAAVSTGSGTVYAGQYPDHVNTGLVSGNFFQFLGVKPALGRAFVEGEDRDGADPVVVLGHNQWRTQFGADSSVIGRSIRLNEMRYTVVGVLPQGFRWLGLPWDVGLWTPRRLSEAEVGPHFLAVLGRLKPGVGMHQIAAELGPIVNGIHVDAGHALTWDVPETAVTVASLHEALLGHVRVGLLLLLGAIGFVLLLTCANIANLLLGRAEGRKRELAIRSSLGASRGRLVRQLLAEALVLAVIGGTLGLLLARWGTQLLVAISPGNIPRLEHVALDGWVIVVCLATTVFSGILFGTLPALQSSRPNFQTELRTGSDSVAGGLRRHRVRAALLVGELAVALVLLIGAGLMVNSFLRLRRIDLGFDTTRIVKADVLLPRSSYAEDAGQDVGGTDFVRLLPPWAMFPPAVLEYLDGMPAVQSAWAAAFVPLSGYYGGIAVTPEGTGEFGSRSLVSHNLVTPQFFQAMGIPLLRGRAFTAADRDGAPQVAIVSAGMAREFWPDQDPIGKRIVAYHGSPDPDPYVVTKEVVGVVGNVKEWELRRGPFSAVYTPLSQGYRVRPTWDSNLRLSFFVKTDSDPTSIASGIRAAVRAVDPEVPVYNIQTMEQVVSILLSEPRFYAYLLTLFASLALLLAVVGVSGVIAFLVTQRTHEIGVRIALGARQRDLIALIVREVLILTAVGLAIGVASALALTRLLSRWLYELDPTDPQTFVLICVLLSTVAFFASYVPARRAARMNPMVALRSE